MKNIDQSDCPTNTDLENVLRELSAIRREMVDAPDLSSARLEKVHSNYQESARNLLHYLALRRHDLRPLQLRLAALGLSSLGRAESHVLATVDSVLKVLHLMLGIPEQPKLLETAPINFAQGRRLLAEHTECLLGPAPTGRGVRIMVTMPSEAADDDILVRDLLQQGMNCMRINCAHDDAPAWLMMIEHLRRAEHSLGKSCRVVMDLAGPKLRTGPLQPGPAVVRVRPVRDVCGRVISPARVWLTSEGSPQPPPSAASACLPLPATWIGRLRVGEEVRFVDARGAKRAFAIVDVTDLGCLAEITKTAYLIPGTIFRRDHDVAKSEDREAAVGRLIPVENEISLQQNDLLLLTRDLKPGRPANFDTCGQMLTPAQIGCTIPQVFDDVQVG